MNKIGIAALATAVISASAAAKDTSTIEVNLGSNFKGYLGSNLTLDQLTGARAKNTSLYQTNWSGFTVGSVIGQDLWTNYGGAETDFNINATRTGFPGMQSLRITGSSTNRFLYRDLTTEWDNRAAGENIINAEFSIYRGANSTVRSRAGNTTYMLQGDGSTSGSVFFGAMGWRMDMGTGGTGSTAYAQGRLAGVGYFTAAAAQATFGSTATAGTYSFTFGTSVPNVAQSTWVNFFTSRNLTTGELILAYSTNGGTSFTGFTLNAGIVTTPNPTIQLVETDYVTSGAGSGTNISQFGDLAVYTTPAPGAAALLGLAGLVSRRRR